MKEFNTTGVCIEDIHYMVNIDDKINKIIKLIDRRKYFTINRARQYGKTTVINTLYNILQRKYLVIEISFEGLGEMAFSSENKFCESFINLVAKRLKYNNVSKEIIDKWEKDKSRLEKLEELSEKITNLIENNDKESILIIDEVDKNSDNVLFLNFLGMLRTKYLDRNKNVDKTFKSVILASVYDIKNLKLKYRSDEERKYNSPWNIAIDFDIEMGFNTLEIATMLIEYEKYNNTGMDIDIISRELYRYTSGYPFLVSKICSIIDEKLDESNSDLLYKWSLEGVQKAVKIITENKNTLTDDLIKNIENNKDLYKFIESIIIQNKMVDFVHTDNLISLGVTYGIFDKTKEGKVKIHNKIFEIILYNHMISKISREENNIHKYNFRDNFIDEYNNLDMESILIKFQQFMKENYSDKDDSFLEKNGRLLLMAFIKPIINGIGFYFIESQISYEKRMDMVITYKDKKYIIEFKIWYGEIYHKKGELQLVDYLDIQNLDKGYLVIFNFNKNKEYKNEWVSVHNKNIFEVIV